MVSAMMSSDILGSDDSETQAWLSLDEGRGSAHYVVDFNGDGYSVRFIADDTDKLMELECGCITIGDDGSRITCNIHTSPEAKALFAGSVPL